MKRRITSILLVACMMISLIPSTVYATETNDYEHDTGMLSESETESIEDIQTEDTEAVTTEAENDNNTGSNVIEKGSSEEEESEPESIEDTQTESTEAVTAEAENDNNTGSNVIETESSEEKEEGFSETESTDDLEESESSEEEETESEEEEILTEERFFDPFEYSNSGTARTMLRAARSSSGRYSAESGFGGGLTKQQKRVYDALVNQYVGNDGLSNGNTDNLVFSPGEDPFGGLTTDDIFSDLSYGYWAFIYDYPEMFWIGGVSISTSYTKYTGGSNDLYVLKSATFAIQEKYSGAKTQINTYNTNVKDIADLIYTSANDGRAAFTYDYYMEIHEWMCDHLSYHDDAIVYPDRYKEAYSSGAVFGYGTMHNSDYRVTCQGYGETFKVLCDVIKSRHSDDGTSYLYCAMVSGYADNGETHMWNYVYMPDNYWYGMDTLWDDQTDRIYKYFLCGSNSVGINSTFSQEHIENKTFSSNQSVTFSYPQIRSERYNGTGDGGIKQITTSFSDKTYETSLTFSWGLDYLTNISGTNKSLAIAGLLLSKDIYSGEQAVMDRLTELGLKDKRYDPIKFIDYDSPDQNAAIMVAVKRTIVNGQGYNYITCVCRGTAGKLTESEWRRNLLYSSGFFKKRGDWAYHAIEYALKAAGINSGISDENNRFFITGHSLGGATANYVSHNLLLNDVAKEHLTCYTFASPFTTGSSFGGDKDKEIYNYVGTKDVVPTVGQATNLAMGVDVYAAHSRYGNDIFMNYTDDFQNTFEQLYGVCCPYIFIDKWNDGSTAQNLVSAFACDWIIHELYVYLAQLLSSSRLETLPAANGARCVIVQCPVDLYIYDSNNNVVASVVNNEVVQAGNDDVIIAVWGDQKYVTIAHGTDYSIKMVGNNAGYLTYSVQDYKPSDEETGFTVTEQVYENVQLFSGKEMLSDIQDGNSVNEIELSTIDEKNNKLNSINEDGSEVPIAEDAHSHFGTWIVTENPSESGVGTEELFCDFCHETTIVRQFTKEECRHESLEHVEGIDATCTENGALEYWHCNVCDQYFLDSSAMNEVEKDGWILPALGHISDGCIDPSMQSICVICDTVLREATEEDTIVASGFCGDGLEWIVSKSGELRITGTGEIFDYITSESTEWHPYSDNIRSIIVEEGITSIGNNAFADMQNVERIIVPNSVIRIGTNILEGCYALEEITVPFIGQNRDSTSETAVLGYFFNKVSTGGVLQCYKKEGTSLSGYQYGIPQSLKKVVVTSASRIPFGTFYNCSNLSEIVLNEGITEIASYSFTGCSGLTELIIPKSVTAIEEYALNGCVSIESLTIPFIGTSRNANATYDSVFGHIFGRTAQSDSNYYVQYYNVEGTSLRGYGYAVPTALKKVTVTDAKRIPIGAFSNLPEITEITINGGLSNIEGFAFYKTSGLTDIYYQDTEAAWMEVPIGDGNEVLGNVVIHFLEEAPKEAAVIQAASLTLAGQIGVNIKMLLPDSIISDPDAYAVMSYNGGKEVSITIPVSEASIESGKYVFTCPVAVKEINDPVSIQLYYGDGTQAELVKGENLRVPVEGNCFQYAVSDYIAAKKGSTEEIGGLVRTMSDLGAAARIYFGYETEGAAIEADLSEVTAEDLQDYKMELTPAAAEGIKIYSASLDLESETSINVKFAATGDSFNIGDYTFTVDGEAVTPTVGLDGRYQICIENITAKLLDDMFTVTVSDKNGNAQAVRYGALSYAYSKLNSSKSGEKIKNLSKCLYLYSKAAEAYFN